MVAVHVPAMARLLAAIRLDPLGTEQCSSAASASSAQIGAESLGVALHHQEQQQEMHCAEPFGAEPLGAEAFGRAGAVARGSRWSP